MENLRERAAQLRRQGLTSHRAFRVLKREFPGAERDILVRASQIPGAPTGYLPSWAQRYGKTVTITQDGKLHPRIEANGGILRPVITRKPPKGA